MLSPDFLKTAKRIIRAAAEVGLDEAGTRIVGSAWPAVKKMLAPLMDELDKRFPALTLADTPEAAKAADAAVEALDTDPALQAKLAQTLQQLADEQHGMAALLAQADESLAALGDSIDRGFSSNDAKLDAILARLNADADADELPTTDGGADTPGAALMEAIQHNQVAVSALFAGDNDSVRAEIAIGRQRAEAALARWPGDLSLVVALGFLEKTGAQADFDARPHEAVAALARAARYFARGRHAPDHNIAVSAANGIANVYDLLGDYDRAIRIGAQLFRTDPDYGAAVGDYSVALEARRRAEGDDAALLAELARVYARLASLAADPSQGFPEGYAAAVARDAASVSKALTAIAGRPPAAPASS